MFRDCSAHEQLPPPSTWPLAFSQRQPATARRAMIADRGILLTVPFRDPVATPKPFPSVPSRAPDARARAVFL